MNSTLFYVFGIALAVSAVLITFMGLRMERFPGRALPVVVIWFVVLIGAALTFDVLNGKDESDARAAEAAAAAGEASQAGAATGEAAQTAPAGGQTGKAAAPAQARGPGSTLKLAAEPTALAYDKKTLQAKPGKVTIDFDNPSSIPHDVAIEKGSQEIAVSDQITQSSTSVSANLAPGTYTFLCTVPGHAQAGMKGTLTVR